MNPAHNLDELLQDFKERLEALTQKPSFDWRHEQLARSLCIAQGHDPDLKVVDVSRAEKRAFGSVSAHAVEPQWHLFLTMATGLVDALSKGETP